MKSRAERMAQAVDEIAAALEADTLRPEDREALIDIMHTTDRKMLKVYLRMYYSDRDRADRTPREFMYVHLGMLLA